MTGERTALAEQHAELDGLLAARSAEDWSRPVPRCPGWTVADVVLHVAQTDEMALASLDGRFEDHLTQVAAGLADAATVDDGADALVAAERGATGPELLARWRRGAQALDEALEHADPRGRVRWVAGELTVRTLSVTRLAEAWIHTGDVADAVGIELAAAPRLVHVARLAWRTLPYAFERAGKELRGPVAFHLVGPDGESWDFVPENPPATVVRGEGVALCEVAARRRDPATADLVAEGPDAPDVLAFVRTYA